MEVRALLSTFSVTTTADNGDNTNPTAGSLRQAILENNADTGNPAADTIDFNIPGSGVQVIQPPADLPFITHPVFIDGYSQTGSQQNSNPITQGDNAKLLIQLDGSQDTSGGPGSYNLLPYNSLGLTLLAGATGSTVRGLDITRFGAGIDGEAAGIVLEGKFIGTDPTGTVAMGNIGGASVGPGSLVGTNGGGMNDDADRNLITGNLLNGLAAFGPQTVVAGNFIGTDVSGTLPLGNGTLTGSGVSGLHVDGGVRVGADGQHADPGERNVISANFAVGILVGSNCVVAGNYIGTDLTGEDALGNGAISNGAGAGIEIIGTNSRIGTDGDGVGDSCERNVIVGGESLDTDGILIGSGGASDVIAGNYIGTDANGTIALGNFTGVNIGYGSDIRVGPSRQDLYPADERNVISGNVIGIMISTNNNTISGNFIGTDPTGTTTGVGGSLGNQVGIYASGGTLNVIGTNSGGIGDAAERNIITGNVQGIEVGNSCGFDDNTIAGNYIGTDVTGTNLLAAAPGTSHLAIHFAGAATGNVIGVNSQAADPADGRNVIEGEISFDSSSSAQQVTQNVIAGNDIGTDVTGEHALSAGIIAIADSPTNRIGTDGAGVADALERNVITGGIEIEGAAAGNLVAGNSIGTDATGTVPLSFGTGITDGVDLSGAGPTQIGGAGDMGNVIAFNSGWGVGALAGSSEITIQGNSIYDNGAVGVAVSTDSTAITIRANSIYANGALGIDRGIDGVTLNTPEGPLNFPVLSTAYAGSSTTVIGTLNSVPSSTLIIDFYANGTPDPAGYGQGRYYLGSTTVKTDTNGNASFAATALGATATGEWLSATATIPGGDTSEFSQDIQILPSIVVTNSTASGSLTLSGNASINIPGAVAVDSNSSTALSVAGNAKITASVIDVAGGFQRSGNASISPAPTTGASVPDPLAGLASPSTGSLTNYGSLSLAGSSSLTICQGIYSQIKVSGNASLTMNSGIYIIEGGGFTVTGNASVAGSGVMIYNAGSNYPSSGGTFGGLTFSGNGTFNLSAPTSGTYAGILIFQSRQNTRALSFSGNAIAGMSGTIYAANALLSMSGNASLQNALDVGMLNLTGNVTLTQIAAGSDGTGDSSGIANTLLAGNLSVYVNNSSGLFTSDELERIQDAINTWDALLVPYNVTITEVSDPTLANVVIDTGTTSACGGMANGVLGCYNEPNNEITMLSGWSWYAGSDPTQIGANQYDFETTMLHELGHALGLGGSSNPSSPMFEILAAGVVYRTVTTQDLNIPAPPEGADPQIAAGFRFEPTAPAPAPAAVVVALGSGASVNPVGLMPLSPSAAGAALNSFSTGLTVHQPALVPVQPMINVQTGFEASLVAQGTAPQNEQAAVPAPAPVATDDLPPGDPSGDSAESALPTGQGAQGDPQPIRGLEGPAPEAEPPGDPSTPRSGTAIDFDLEALASELVRVRGWNAARMLSAPGPASDGTGRAAWAVNPLLRDGTVRESHAGRKSGSYPSALMAILLAAGFCGHGSRIATASKQKAKDSRTALAGRCAGPDFRLGRKRHHSPAQRESPHPR
jgi:titin